MGCGGLKPLHLNFSTGKNFKTRMQEEKEARDLMEEHNREVESWFRGFNVNLEYFLEHPKHD